MVSTHDLIVGHKILMIFLDSSQNGSPSLVSPSEPNLSVKKETLPGEKSNMKNELEEFCRNLQSCAESRCESDYVDRLRDSCDALDKRISQSQVEEIIETGSKDLLLKYLHDCEKYFEKINSEFMQYVVDSGSLSHRLGMRAKHFPRISPMMWLSQLHRDRFGSLSTSWKAAIIEYGLAVTHLHRAQRLVSVSSKPVDLIEEVSHVGHTNWDPHEYPETLLLEAESGIMIRKEQEFIASHMRTPQNNQNIVLQLLMGGGKSTVVVPMVASWLTDKEK